MSRRNFCSTVADDYLMSRLHPRWYDQFRWKPTDTIRLGLPSSRLAFLTIRAGAKIKQGDPSTFKSEVTVRSPKSVENRRNVITDPVLALMFPTSSGTFDNGKMSPGMQCCNGAFPLLLLKTLSDSTSLSSFRRNLVKNGTL
jgi:hypothetical protein